MDALFSLQRKQLSEVQMKVLNVETRTTAWGVLAIVAIVSALQLNLTLLFVITRRAGGLTAIVSGPRGPRLQTLVSLTLGDIFLTLFSLVVTVIEVFEGPKFLTCRTYTLSYYCLAFLMPFVYSSGLIVLVFECVMFKQRVRAKPFPQSPGVKKSLAISAVPWILGIATVLSLTLAGADLDKCEFNFSLGRKRATVFICQLLPAAVALMCTIVNLRIMQNPAKSSSAENQEVATNYPTSSSGHTDFTRAAPTVPIEPVQPKKDLASTPTVPFELDIAVPHRHLPLTRAVPKECVPPHKDLPSTLISQIELDLLTPHRDQSPMSTVTISTELEPPHRGGSSSKDAFGLPKPKTCTPTETTYSSKEACALFVSSLALFVCVVPWGVFELSSSLIEDYENPVLTVLLSDLVYLMLAARPCVMPFLWVITRSLEKPRSTVSFSTC